MKASTAPRTAVPEVRARDSTADRVGPMQGVQLTANSTPSSGAPISPARGRIAGRTIRPVIGKRSNTPANISPSTIVTPPSTWVTPAWCRTSTSPRPPKARPSVANTSEKPRTNSAVPSRVRPRRAPRRRAAVRPAGPRSRWPPGARRRRRRRGRRAARHGGPVGRHRHPLRRGRLGPLRVRPGHAGHVGQVAGNQRQDAGGQERQRTGRGRDRGGQDQRPGLDQVLDPHRRRLLFAPQTTASRPAPVSGCPVSGHCRGGTARIYCSGEFSCWFAEKCVRSRPVVRIHRRPPACGLIPAGPAAPRHLR